MLTTDLHATRSLYFRYKRISFGTQSYARGAEIRRENFIQSIAMWWDAIATNSNWLIDHLALGRIEPSKAGAKSSL
jgi:hypothetical protein